ncbi:DUF502 domain-containing protein [Shinella sp. PSBB067]|uniref:DUF502 domain-containing protein n=1 Tax=unclassified Shinella TaxID=2643062 RepID=UPI000926AA4A|nr:MULTISPECIES: DUF502 domain-containing protein [unclassified Shinella]OJU93103.1 MAG: hypothetical protein BGO06_15875 [Shinella sp. 65-6]QRI65050.1 DUF502 domain-containing protein [Shinella sp. PSBB067]
MTDLVPRQSLAMRLRNNFLTGLVICAPIAITIWLTWTFIHWADSWVKPYIPAPYNPENYFQFAIPGFGLLIALVFITLIGFLGKNLIGRTIVEFGDSLFNRTPLVRTVHKSLKQIFETVLKDKGTSFNRAAMIEYPSAGLWSIVFVATDARGEIATKFKSMGKDMVACFLPPTPFPTAGFLVYVPREKLVPLDMSAEDAAKLIISVGLVTPPEKSLELIESEEQRKAKAKSRKKG